MATITRKALKFGVVVGTVPAACIALGYRMRAVQASENQEGPRVFKACDLPIYNVANRRDEADAPPPYPRNSMEKEIGNIRRGFQDYYDQNKGTVEEIRHTMAIGVEHSKSTLDFVQNNPGELPRVAFITVGSLGGFILGYRGSILRRLLYGTVAGVSCAALCYPSYTLAQSTKTYKILTDGWEDFSSEELLKGNWPFLTSESVDEQNRKKLGLAESVSSTEEVEEKKISEKPAMPVGSGTPNFLKKSDIKQVSNELPEESQRVPTPLIQGDPGQANPEDKDMYSTRSS